MKGNPTPWEEASNGRIETKTPGQAPTKTKPGSPGFRELQSADQNGVQDWQQPRQSSYPHLTEEFNKRAQHVTSNYNLGPLADPTGQRNLSIHARTHQDNEPGKPIQLDRFMAVNNDTGQTYTATAKLNPEIHQKKGATAPTRNDTLASVQQAMNDKKLVFSVGDQVDTKQPPLSPRSRTRQPPK